MSGRRRGPRGKKARGTGNFANRRRFLLTVWVLSASVLLGRAAEVQVVQADRWSQLADDQHQRQSTVAAERGLIVDRNGIPLALSHETFRVAVAPAELKDPAEASSILESVLQLSGSDARRITTSDRRWVTISGRFPPSVREALSGQQGIHLERELRRFYPQGGLGRGLLGTVIDQTGSGGIEQEFEEHLRGSTGAEVVARDSGGRPIPGETWTVRRPHTGGSVVLSLEASLQEIAHEALKDAIESTGSKGGDLLVTDPRTGEVLAMVSMRDGVAAHVGSINAPYEPGSTLKPFTVAALLREGRASLDDSVDTGNGTWTVRGRTIRDVSAVGTVSLRHALQVSSNVGIARVAQRLEPEEQYEGLRDFGFGLPTGIPLPGEAAGTLRRPSQWSGQSAASLAIGYEIAVTPIQMAMAYGALANGGVLMQPLLVKELRDATGASVERFDARAIRRIISPEEAHQITEALVGAVEEGTGTRARLASFAVAGKSGTSRAYARNGGYEAGAYFASFVGFFPADDPQLVVFVKLERPQGTYYGGATAAPVTRATMEAILAARESPLDPAALSALARSQRLHEGRRSQGAVSARLTPTFASTFESAGPITSQSTFAELPVDGIEGDGSFGIPDVQGLSARAAARRLHSLGLSVTWEASGVVSGSIPRAGNRVAPGDTIQLLSIARAIGAGADE
jgi:cell division protein FtsI (penicillin-binding protein 3)